jgi:hypothetical protein
MIHKLIYEVLYNHDQKIRDRFISELSHYVNIFTGKFFSLKIEPTRKPNISFRQQHALLAGTKKRLEICLKHSEMPLKAESIADRALSRK